MFRKTAFMLLSILLFSACAAKTPVPSLTPSQSSTPAVTVAATTAAAVPTTVIGTASASATATVTATTSPNKSVDDLLKLVHDTDPQTDITWVKKNYILPDKIQDFGHSSDIDSKYITDDMTKILAYIKVIDNQSMDFDDVVLQKSGTEDEYAIVNESKGYKNYPLAQSNMIFVNFEGTDIRYSITMDFLPKQLNWKQNNLYNVYLKDGQIKLLIEQYQP
jgi:hypothetical protein